MAGSPIFSVNFTNWKNAAVLNYHKSWSWSKSLRVSSLLELKYSSNIILSMLRWNKLSSRRELTSGDFSRRFSAEAAWKVKMLWRQKSPVTPCFGQKILRFHCHAMLWTENIVTNIQRLETNKNIEIPQNRLVWSGSRLMIVQNGWIFSICEIY